ncbi:MAG: hypothetical protein ACLFQC_02200 [Wenzhouxiangella sp.]
MRIESSELSLSAGSAFKRLTREVDTQIRQTRIDAGSVPAGGVSLDISSAARSMAAESSLSAPPSSAKDEETVTIDPRVLLAARILARFFGRDITLFVMRKDSAESVQETAAPTQELGAETAVRISRTRVVAETESLRFEAKGRVQTADGRAIDIDLRLELDRAWFEVSQLDMNAVQPRLQDPLVLNLDAASARLRPERFEFDLAASGRRDSLPVLDGASGYLARDANGNGKIDDGSELFGALSGDGFADLQALDSDSNGWLDAADLAFESLGVWIDAGTSGARLESLKQVGIGAISLDNVTSSFALTNARNDLLGQLRSTGVFLYEDGRAGTVQQLDLAV